VWRGGSVESRFRRIPLGSLTTHRRPHPRLDLLDRGPKHAPNWHPPPPHPVPRGAFPVALLLARQRRATGKAHHLPRQHPGHHRSAHRTRSDLETAFLAFFRLHRIPLPEVNVKLGRWEVDFLWREEKLASRPTAGPTTVARLLSRPIMNAISTYGNRDSPSAASPTCRLKKSRTWLPPTSPKRSNP
jgi:hypothetical protein